MFDSPKELLDKIRLGEDSTLELKEVRFAGKRISGPHRDALADELAAFANSRGGVCVLGVEDKTRKLLGIPLERLDEVEGFVRELCRDSIDPPLLAYTERLWLPSATGQELAIVKIEVPRSLFVHKSPSGYMHRVNDAKQEMRPEYLARLFQQRSQTRIIRFDEQPVPDATLDDLKPELWSRFRTQRSGDDRVDLLVKLGMARVDEDGETRPTVSGILMAAAEPRTWFPNAFVQAVAYKGRATAPQSAGDTYQLDGADITGPLDWQILDACRFVRRNMRVAATKDMGRRDIPQFDMSAVFEAIVNAAAHRDYSIHGSKIRLRLFEDRLELYSPGAILNSMTIESLPYRQASRNETITSLLAKVPIPSEAEWLSTNRRTLMDKRGEGVPLIIDRSFKLSGKSPEYRLIDDAELQLTIFSANRASDE